MSGINIYFYLLLILDYEGDVVTLCNIPHVNVGYKYLLLLTYDVYLIKSKYFFRSIKIKIKTYRTDLVKLLCKVCNTIDQREIKQELRLTKKILYPPMGCRHPPC